MANSNERQDECSYHHGAENYRRRDGSPPWCRVCNRNRNRLRRATQSEAKSEQERLRSRTYAREAHQLRRQLVLDHYGRECVCCGETNEIFLAIDHIDGGGNEHRREIGNGKLVGSANVYRWFVVNQFPKGFQTLCHNCNWAKSHGGCPHNA